jgi:two-component system, chemotaxis family, response regulator Rcp1
MSGRWQSVSGSGAGVGFKPEAAPQGSAGELISGVRDAQATGPRVVLLMVEDNQGDVYLVQKAIEFHGVPVHVLVAQDGEQALEYFRRASTDPTVCCPGMLLVDLNLPKKSGLEVLEAVRKSGKCSQVPVVVFTSSDSPKDRERATSLGALRYFRKPSTFQEFLKIGEVLNDVLQEVKSHGK